VQMWLVSQLKTCYSTGIPKLVHHLTRCVQEQGDQVENEFSIVVVQIFKIYCGYFVTYLCVWYYWWLPLAM